MPFTACTSLNVRSSCSTSIAAPPAIVFSLARRVRGAGRRLPRSRARRAVIRLRGVSASREPVERVAEESLSSQPDAVVRTSAPPFGGGAVSAGGVLAMQRRAGNAATVATLRRAGRIPLAVATQRLREARATRPGSPLARGTRFRVPSATELKSLYGAGQLDKADIEDAVRRVLRRMDLDFALRTDADDVMKKLFPGGGVFDETAWAGVLGTGTSDVYHSVADAEAKLKAADLKKLTDVAKLAADKIDQAMAD